MKNEVKILLFIGTLIFGLGFYYLTKAAVPSIYVSPASLTKNTGEMFDILVGVNPSGEKVCVVEGKLILDNLLCKAIKIKEDVMVQSSPSCENSYFLIGIPGCTTNEKSLFTVTVKAQNAGTATASFHGVDIIGEGVSISSAFRGGNYTLVSPVTPSPICNCTEWSQWQLGECEVGGCSPIQRLQIRTRTCTPRGCDIESESQCIEDQTCIPIEEAEKKVIPPKETPISLFLATLGVIRETTWMGIITLICLIALSVIGILEWRRRRKKKIIS